MRARALPQCDLEQNVTPAGLIVTNAGSVKQLRFPVAPQPGPRIIPRMAHLLTRRVAAWFTLTREERWLAAGVLALLLLGLGARAWHLHAKTSEPYVPPEAVHE